MIFVAFTPLFNSPPLLQVSLFPQKRQEKHKRSQILSCNVCQIIILVIQQVPHYTTPKQCVQV